MRITIHFLLIFNIIYLPAYKPVHAQGSADPKSFNENHLREQMLNPRRGSGAHIDFGSVNQQIERAANTGNTLYLPASSEVTSETRQNIQTEVITNGDRRKIQIHFTDPNTNERLTLESEIDRERASRSSPQRIYQWRKMMQEHNTLSKLRQQNNKPVFRSSIADFPLEAVTFYFGLGLNNLINLVALSHNDPLIFQRYLESMTDPVAQASFFAFILGNRAGSQAMNKALLSSVMQKKISPAATARISQHIIPHLGMAVGGIASNVAHDFLYIFGECSKAMLGTDEQAKEKLCEQAWQNFVTDDKMYEYVVNVSALVASSFAAAGIRMTAAGVARTQTIQGIKMRLATVANYIPIPQFQLGVKARHVLHGGFNLVLFLKLDELIFHPLFHNQVEQRLNSGPKLMRAQNAMRRRLNTSHIERLRPNTDAYNRFLSLQRSMPGSFVRDMPPPTHNKPIDSISFGVVDGAQPLWIGRRARNSIVNNTNLQRWPWLKNEDPSNHLDVINFNELLEDYHLRISTWRQSYILFKFMNSYYAWFEHITPFNTKANTAINFYLDFFETLEESQYFRRPLNQLNTRHDLLHEDYYFNVTRRERDGSLRLSLFDLLDESFNLDFSRLGYDRISNIIGKNVESQMDLEEADFERLFSYLNEDLSLTQVEELQANTLRLASCYFEKALKEQSNLMVGRNPRMGNATEDSILSLIRLTHQGLAQQSSGIKCDFNDPSKSRLVDSSKTMDKVKARNSLLALQNLIIRYERLKREDRFNPAAHRWVEQGIDFIGPDFFPYERGEKFLMSWNHHIKEQFSDDYIKIFGDLPGHSLLHDMACGDKPEDPNNKIVDSNLFKNSIINWALGRLKFNPPRVTNRPSELCNDYYIHTNRMFQTDLARTNHYKMRKRTMDAAYVNLQNHIFNDLNKNVFDLDWSNNKYNNRFEYWWDTNIEPMIKDTFMELNQTYRRNVENNLLPKIEMRQNNRPDVDPPKSLISSYIEPIDLYLQFLVKAYSPLARNDSNKLLIHDLAEDLKTSLSELLLSFRNITSSKEAPTIKYAEVLAHYKKLKSLFQYRDRQNDMFKRFTPADPLTRSQMSEEEAIVDDFKLNFLNYARILTNGNKNELRYEYTNGLENRLLKDNFVAQAFGAGGIKENGQSFPAALSQVAQKYMSLKPANISYITAGDGIESIYMLLDMIFLELESAYEITNMIRLIDESAYMDPNEERPRVRRGGSIFNQ